MRKSKANRRESIDFSKGVRGKYIATKLVIVGPTRGKIIKERRK